jgi:peptidoglycan/LPS O-acetylase OafA/YrhL
MIREFQTNNFNLLRIFAATQVLLIHSYLYLQVVKPQWLNILELFPGVPMFFIMSGYLISASLERNPNLLNYFKNRALRIYPGLCCCIIMSVITISIVGKVNFISVKSLLWFISQCVGLIYTPSFLAGYGTGSYQVSLWTIPVELQFYLALPVVYILINVMTKNARIKTYLLTSIFFIFCAVSMFIFYNYAAASPALETGIQKLFRYSFLPHIYMFLFGVILQRLNVYKWDIIYNKGAFWVIGYLLFKAGIPEHANFVFEIASYLILGLTSISLAYSYTGLSEKILRGNDISYGIYIYHGLTIGVIVELGFKTNETHVIAVFVVTYIISILSWNFVEKPALKKKKLSLHPIEDYKPLTPTQAAHK